MSINMSTARTADSCTAVGDTIMRDELSYAGTSGASDIASIATGPVTRVGLWSVNVYEHPLD